MRKIKFGDSEFNLAGDVTATPERFQATVFKGKEHSFDDVVNSASNCNNITVLDDDGETIGVYHGYTKEIAFSAYMIFIEDHEERVISVELMNTDITEQIRNIANEVNIVKSSVGSIKEEQLEHLNMITNAENNIANIHNNIETLDSAIVDIAETLDDTQSTQDLAIEDLAEAVDSIINPEE